MSTINQMLHDLNARTTGSSNPNLDHYSSHANPPTKDSRKYIVGTVLFSLFAVALITHLITKQQHSSTEQLPQPIAQVTKANDATHAIDEMSLENTANVTDNTSEMMSPPATDNTMQNVLPAAMTMTISDTSGSQVTPLSIDSPAELLSTMNINTSNGEVRFIAGLQDAARLAIQSNDTNSAINALQGLLSAKPYDHNSRLLLARLYFQSNQPDVALNLLQVAPSEDDLPMSFLSFRASLFTEVGEHRRAIGDYQVLSRLEPNNVRWQLGVAIAFDQLDEYGDAKFAYEQVKLIGDLPNNINVFVEQRINILKDLI